MQNRDKQADNERFWEAMGRIDEANSEDPNKEEFEGQMYPKELLYSQRMSRWLARLAPDATETLQLAVRAQHICRWAIPRDSYPIDREGYHRWRSDLGRFHAQRTGNILRSCGYDENSIQRLESLIRKERFKADPEAQTLEDVACLVFLQSHFSDFANQHEDEKIVGILRRTWKKMSAQGQSEALTLPFSAKDRALIERALSSAGE
ncbi:MAG TPA: DUF4202 domain-containing protein [Capsulimonadaceae bacterium]|nr:DUF4202 domain-containing protein [Capsulimonadaceae bacterium]